MSDPRPWLCLLLAAAAAGGCATRGGEAERASRGLWMGPLQLCEATVAGASSVFDVSGEPALLVTLKPSAQRRFAELTARNVGRSMAIRLDGRTLSEPIIREPITGGQLQVTGIDPGIAAEAATGAC